MDNRNVLPHVRSFLLSLNIFPHVQSVSICSTLSIKKLMTLVQGPSQLVSANTVPMCLTGGAGAKPLLGSANTVQCQVRLG